MRKDRIAERLMSQVITQERTASIVGDFMESAATRDDLRLVQRVAHHGRPAGAQFRGRTGP
jgi:hypothetical protein